MASVEVGTSRDHIRVIVVGGPINDKIVWEHLLIREWWISMSGAVIQMASRQQR